MVFGSLRLGRGDERLGEPPLNTPSVATAWRLKTSTRQQKSANNHMPAHGGGTNGGGRERLEILDFLSFGGPRGPGDLGRRWGGPFGRVFRARGSAQIHNI